MRNLLIAVENTYWDLVYQYHRLDSLTTARRFAAQLWDQDRKRVEFGQDRPDDEPLARQQYYGYQAQVESALTEVVFKTLSDREIDWYIHTGEPFDKAGAYAIQGLGTFLVRAVNGSYTNVVGLPVCEVIEYLIKEEVIRFGAMPPAQGSFDT